MKLYFHRRYDRHEGRCDEDFSHGVAEALLNGFAVPDAPRCQDGAARLESAGYRELQGWAKALGIQAVGSAEDVRRGIQEALGDE